LATRQLLRNAHVYDHDDSGDIPAVKDVLIEGDTILSVGPDLERGAGNAEQVDLSGYVLLPGFVNAHYHSHDTLAKGFFESMPLEQWGLVAGAIANGRSLEEVRARTLVGAIDCLRNGITTVQDFAAFAPMEDRYVDTILDAYAEAGIRVIFSVTVRDLSQLDTIPWAGELLPPELHGIVGNRADAPDPQLAFIERQIDRIGDRGGMVIWALSPSAPQRCSPRLLGGIADLARRRQLPVYTHVYETRAQRVFVRDRYPEHRGSIVDYMESVGLVGPHVTIAHGVWPDAKEIEKLAATGTGVVLNMLSNLRLRSGVAPISAYRRLGVPIALGCDNCSCSDVQSMFQVMKLYCLLGGIFDPKAPAPLAAEALSRATVGGARSAGKEQSLGAIRPGMKADLVALDLSDAAYRPLHNVVRQVVYAETGRSVRHVWVNGRRVIRNGTPTLFDEARLDSNLADIMPGVKQELARLRLQADRVQAAFEEIQRRAWIEDIGYTRYLERN
jgi:cytosine/adenosine deaminase-related metal-dependent hydrolase